MHRDFQGLKHTPESLTGYVVREAKRRVVNTPLSDGMYAVPAVRACP